MKKAKVVFSPSVIAYLKTNKTHKELEPEDIELIKTWVQVVEVYGAEILQHASRAEDLLSREAAEAALEKPAPRSFERLLWRDHALHGEWAGCRSSSFSPSGRIIYMIQNGKVEVIEVVRITNRHNYRR